MTAYTEYQIDLMQTEAQCLDTFVKAVGKYDTYEEALETAKICEPLLKDGYYLNIIFIDYDENGDEIAFGSVV